MSMKVKVKVKYMNQLRDLGKKVQVILDFCTMIQLFDLGKVIMKIKVKSHVHNLMT